MASRVLEIVHLQPLFGLVGEVVELALKVGWTTVDLFAIRLCLKYSCSCIDVSLSQLEFLDLQSHLLDHLHHLMRWV